MQSAFPDVIRLVGAARELERWELIAFRQRMEGAEVNVNGKTHSLKNVYFKHEKTDDGKIDAAIYVAGYEEEMARELFLLLDSLLGEYDVETKLRHIEFRELGERRKDLNRCWNCQRLWTRNCISCEIQKAPV